MSAQVILPDLFSATSSPALAVGATPCALPDGPRTDLFGRAVAHASHSARPVPGGGVTDERHLWPTWFNLIRKCRPDVIFGEQVDAAINHGWLDLVQADLEGEGYACGAVGLPAGGVGAPHIRQRLWFVADTASKRGNERFELESYGRANEAKQDGLGSKFDQLAGAQHDGGRANELGIASSAGRRTGGEYERGAEMGGGSATAQRGTTGHQLDRTDTIDSQLADANGTRSAAGVSGQEYGEEGVAEVAYHGGGGEFGPGQRSETFWSDCDWLPCRDGKTRPVEPGTFPLAHGVSGRVGRLRAYGNAIVPQVAQVFIEAYLES